MRRNSIIMLLTFLFLFAVGYSQEEREGFHGGVRVGLNASQISGDDLVGFNKMGASAGVFVNHSIIPSGRLKLQLELNFSMKGSHSKAPASRETNDFYVLNLGYVEMPLLLRSDGWSFWVFPFEFMFEFGPVFGVNVYQKEREANGQIVGRPQFRRFEFSAMTGVSFVIAKKHHVGLRYSNSIVPVRIPNWAYDRVVMKQFNSVLTIGYAYEF